MSIFKIFGSQVVIEQRKGKKDIEKAAKGVVQRVAREIVKPAEEPKERPKKEPTVDIPAEPKIKPLPDMSWAKLIDGYQEAADKGFKVTYLRQAFGWYDRIWENFMDWISGVVSGRWLISTESAGYLVLGATEITACGLYGYKQYTGETKLLIGVFPKPIVVRFIGYLYYEREFLGRRGYDVMLLNAEWQPQSLAQWGLDKCLVAYPSGPEGRFFDVVRGDIKEILVKVYSEQIEVAPYKIRLSDSYRARVEHVWNSILIGVFPGKGKGNFTEMGLELGKSFRVAVDSPKTVEVTVSKDQEGCAKAKKMPYFPRLGKEKPSIAHLFLQPWT
jgi:hypothetical protein